MNKVNNKKSKYVNNLYPVYNFPNPNFKNKPAIIKALVKAALDNNPARNAAWYTVPRFDQKTGLKIYSSRRMNEHRARAINALMTGLADRLNIVSSKVEASVEQLSDWCGLSTKGNKNKKSISRASRALRNLEELGVIICEKIWDDTNNSYIPKIIWVTELFFILINYELGKYISAQKQQLAWENLKLHKKGEKPITITEAKRRIKSLHIKKAFEYRNKNMILKRQYKQAQKLMAMEEKKAKLKILNDLIKNYSQNELENMGFKELKRQTDQRYYSMRKLANINLSTHF